MTLGSRVRIQPPLTSCGNGKNIKDRQVVEVRNSLKDFVNVPDIFRVKCHKTFFVRYFIIFAIS